MKLYYKEGLPVFTESNKITNFSSTDILEIDFEPNDLFIEVASEDNIDILSYLRNFIDNLGEYKAEAIDLIKDRIKYWEGRSINGVDEKLARDGAIKVSKVIDRVSI